MRISASQKTGCDAKPRQATRVVGRFAPSPTGPLHFGSLIAAIGSYLHARVGGGEWLIRIEDLDNPRTIKGATEQIIRTLDGFGFEWNRSIEYQSQRISLYADALSRLKQQGLIYPCSCSRSQISAIDEHRYPGTCRAGLTQLSATTAERCKVESEVITFCDEIQGDFSQNLHAACGDFVVKRRDGIFAYHLAVVVDDAEQGVTEVIRGADLLDSTPRQIFLQRALSLATPRYGHLPLAVDLTGQKLSKSAQSLPIEVLNAGPLLWEGLKFLRQQPPPELREAPTSELWTWAKQHWSTEHIFRLKSDHCPSPQ